MVKITTFARLDSSARGQVVALAGAGWKAPAIRKRAEKTDGSFPTPRAEPDLIANAEGERTYRGKKLPGPGRNRLIGPVLQKRLARLVFKGRGSAPLLLIWSLSSLPLVCP